MDFYKNYIAPNICGFTTVFIGVYFINPMIVENATLNALPVWGNLAVVTKNALLAGLYGVLSITICEQLGIAKFL